MEHVEILGWVHDSIYSLGDDLIDGSMISAMGCQESSVLDKVDTERVGFEGVCVYKTRSWGGKNEALRNFQLTILDKACIELVSVDRIG